MNSPRRGGENDISSGGNSDKKNRRNRASGTRRNTTWASCCHRKGHTTGARSTNRTCRPNSTSSCRNHRSRDNNDTDVSIILA
eukprot:8614496-Pyramimonas_sp.AAC.1